MILESLEDRECPGCFTVTVVPEWQDTWQCGDCFRWNSADVAHWPVGKSKWFRPSG